MREVKGDLCGHNRSGGIRTRGRRDCSAADLGGGGRCRSEVAHVCSPAGRAVREFARLAGRGGRYSGPGACAAVCGRRELYGRACGRAALPWGQGGCAGSPGGSAAAARLSIGRARGIHAPGIFERADRSSRGGSARRSDCRRDRSTASAGDARVWRCGPCKGRSVASRSAACNGADRGDDRLGR